MKMYFLVNVGILHCYAKNGENGDALPETNIFAPENGWLEVIHFLLGWPIFRCELLVFGGVFHCYVRLPESATPEF